MNALVIIDVQNDFMPGGILEVPFGNMIVPVINGLQKHFDLVVATQDWHPKNHVSFASNHPGHDPYEKMVVHGEEKTLWPDHCVQGSTGAAFHRDLDVNKFAAVFRKGTDPEIDSYSAFYDTGRKKSTGLSLYLKERGIKEIYFCGLAADISVYHSIMDALEEGFSATLIEDASQPMSTDTYICIKNELRGKGVRITTSKEISSLR